MGVSRVGIGVGRKGRRESYRGQPVDDAIHPLGGESGCGLNGSAGTGVGIEEVVTTGEYRGGIGRALMGAIDSIPLVEIGLTGARWG